MTGRRLLAFVAALAALSVVGCAAGLVWLSLAQPNSVVLPEPTGQHRVGRVRFDWVDEARTDPLAARPGVARELPVWIWYPAPASATAPAAEYLPFAVADAIDAAAAPLLRTAVGLLSTDRRNVRSHALEAPEVAAGRFPVVLMRPLRGGLAPQYAILAEELASHGYVVVGADMPYTTRIVVYDDGRVVRRTDIGAPSEFTDGRKSPKAPGLPNDLFLPVLDVLVEDGMFLLDRLAELDASDPRFAGRLDLASIGAFGHSVGGTAALEFCAVEARCAAGIDIDGYLMGTVVETGLAKPFMFLMSDRPIFRRREETGDSERELLQALAAVRRGLPNAVQQVVVEGSGHYSFADSALLTSRALSRVTGATGPIDPVQALALTRAYVTRFFDVHLKGKPETLLTELGRRFPEARLD